MIASAATDPAWAGRTESAEQPGRFFRFLEEHGPRLAVSFGLFTASRAYDRTWGPSTDPVLLEDPPGPDRYFHDQWSEQDESGGFADKYALDVVGFGVPLTLILLDARDRPQMARDLLGLVETTWTNGGLTKLLKDIVGRERPDLEYAKEDGLDPETIEELEDKEDSHRSFPSGHASISFSSLAYLERGLARRTGLRGGKRALSFAGLYGLAAYVSYARIAADKHYLSDMVAGAALGITVSRTCYRLNHPEEFAHRKGRFSRSSRLRATVTPEPVRGGLAVMIAFSVEQTGQLRQ